LKKGTDQFGECFGSVLVTMDFHWYELNTESNSD